MSVIIVGLGGKCLDIMGDGKTDNTPIILYSRHGGLNQQWQLNAFRLLISMSAPGKCLQVEGLHGNNGDRIVIGDINFPNVPKPNQRWKLNADGTLTSDLNPNRCIDIDHGIDENGRRIILWDRHGGTNQMWNAIAASPIPFPDLVLLRTDFDQRIFVIEGGQRRLIPDAQTFDHYPQYNRDYIQFISTALMDSIPVGNPVPSYTPPKPPPRIFKVSIWNIAEGGDPIHAETANNKLPEIAARIKSKNADIVLLNEVINWDISIGGWMGNNIKQTKLLSELTQLPFYFDLNVNQLGFTGHKAVSILSKHELKNRVEHFVPKIDWQISYDFGTIEAEVIIHGLTIKILSTRFCPIHWKSEIDHSDNLEEWKRNVVAHVDARRMVSSFNPSANIIFGGDFNADRSRPHFDDFYNNCGLSNAVNFEPDNIFYRGPFTSTNVDIDTDVENMSDHALISVEFVLT